MAEDIKSSYIISASGNYLIIKCKEMTCLSGKIRFWPNFVFSICRALRFSLFPLYLLFTFRPRNRRLTDMALDSPQPWSCLFASRSQYWPHNTAMEPDLTRADKNRKINLLQQNPSTTLWKRGRSNQVLVLMPLAVSIGWCARRGLWLVIASSAASTERKSGNPAS